MDCYVIPPLDALDLMHLGDRYFCLAQLYQKDENYRNFFLSLPPEAWVTLDNGAGDHDTVTRETVLEIAQELHPNELIPLDILFNKEETIKNLEWTIEEMDRLGLGGVNVLACPQGETKEEWLNCYTYMLNHPRVNTIGMSKLAIPHAFLGKADDTRIREARQMCVKELREKGLLLKELHFLGAGDPWEFHDIQNVDYKKISVIRSTDSCFTVWSAMNNLKFEDGKGYRRIPTPRDYFERNVSNSAKYLAAQNVKYLRKILC